MHLCCSCVFVAICMYDCFLPFSPFHLHLPISQQLANNLNQLNFSSALLSLPSSLTCPQKKTPFRVELDLYCIAGKRTAQEEKTYKKTASFLGSAGASLVDLDDLFSSNPKPKQRPLVNTLVAQTQAIGKDRKDASLWVKRLQVELLWVIKMDA